MIWISVVVVFLLVLIEAVFAASEMALVSLREGQISALAERGRRGKRLADLVSNPNRFLSAVQIGVTTTALLSSAFGAVTLSHSTARGLRHLGMSHRPSEVIGFLLVTLVIAYVTLVVGELAPKRIALQRAEATAGAIAPTLDRFAGAMRPVIWLLSVSTDGVVRLLGGDPTIGRETISHTELRDLVTGHEALSRDERKLIDDVFEAGGRQVREIMVPRTEVEFFDSALDSRPRDARGADVAAQPVPSCPWLARRRGRLRARARPLPTRGWTAAGHEDRRSDPRGGDGARDKAGAADDVGDAPQWRSPGRRGR